MIRFLCPGCKKDLQTLDEVAGKAVTCPVCKLVMKVPAREQGLPLERRSKSVLILGQSLPQLEKRVQDLQKEVNELADELRFANRYINDDPGSSLTKSRIVLEKIIIQVYQHEMGREPKKPLLGDMLLDNQFTRTIERRIVSRMNSVRDMGNFGPHGEYVQPADAARVLEDLCVIIEWYLKRYSGKPMTYTVRRENGQSSHAGATQPGAPPASRKENKQKKQQRFPGPLPSAKLAMLGKAVLAASRLVLREIKQTALATYRTTGRFIWKTRDNDPGKAVSWVRPLVGYASIVCFIALVVFLIVPGPPPLLPGGAQTLPKHLENDTAPTKKFTNSLGMEFALVPKGKSWLGGGGGQEGTKEVNITQDFYLGVYLVTQEEWQKHEEWYKVIVKNPSWFTRERVGKEVGDDDLKRFPVENVSWERAKAFVKLVNEKVRNDAKEAGWEYRLPTEEQWEYACRGGPMIDKAESAFDYYFEKPTHTLSKQQANFDSSGLNRPSKVGLYPPNRLGLYDMHGNVWEWCEDEYDKGGRDRASRGGSWWSPAGSCRAAYRGGGAASSQDSNQGFRLARVPSTGK